MRYVLAFIVLLAVAWSGQARAQGASLTVTSPTISYYGTLTLTASTSTSLSTLTSSGTLPTTFGLGKMVVINTGTNAVNICWFGGTCSAAGASETLAAGASDTVYLGAFTTWPTAYSTSGTTLAIHN
ncbi:MAG: hypothetical protein KGL39_26355 [Patescibacteria group bacterium]|nr:hypothetical protein [Patescibacteria group bacterium]